MVNNVDVERELVRKCNELLHGIEHNLKNKKSLEAKKIFVELVDWQRKNIQLAKDSSKSTDPALILLNKKRKMVPAGFVLKAQKIFTRYNIKL